jgi:hypothetical protein
MLSEERRTTDDDCRGKVTVGLRRPRLDRDEGKRPRSNGTSSVVRHARLGSRESRPRIIVVPSPVSLLTLVTHCVRERYRSSSKPVRLRIGHAPSCSSSNTCIVPHALRIVREEVLREGRRGVATRSSLDAVGISAAVLAEGGEAGGVGRLRSNGLGVGGDMTDGIVRAEEVRVEARGNSIPTSN